MNRTLVSEMLNAYCRLVSDEVGGWAHSIARFATLVELLQHPPVGDLKEQTRDLPFPFLLVALGHYVDGDDSASIETLQEARAAFVDETLLGTAESPTFTDTSIVSLRAENRAGSLAVFFAACGAYEDAVQLFTRLEAVGRPRSLWETELVIRSMLGLGLHDIAKTIALPAVKELLRRRRKLHSGALRLNFGGRVGSSLIQLAAAAALAQDDQDEGARLALYLLDLGRDPLLAEIVHTAVEAPWGVLLRLPSIRQCWSLEAEAFQWSDLLSRVLIEQGRNSMTSAIEEKILATESSISDARAAMQETAPSFYSSFFAPGRRLLRSPVEPSVVANAQQKLQHGTAVLGFDVLEDELIGWALTTEHLLVERFAISAATLVADVKSVRASCRAGTLAANPRLAHLSETLLNWAGDVIDSNDRLQIVASGSLRTLPFAVLQRSGRALVSTHICSILPTLGLFAELSGRESPDFRNASIAAFGDPTEMKWTSPLGEETFAPALQNAAREAREVAKIAGEQGEAYCDGAATREAALSSLRNKDILHLATHAVFCEEAPLFSAFLMANGEQLTVVDLIGVQSRCDLIVASACSTGEGGRTSGDDVLGISRGLLACGARSAVVSLWPVDDEHTADLMIKFYSGLRRGFDPARALREAQDGFGDSNSPSPTRYRHLVPAAESARGALGTERWWAPFILVGV